MKPNDVKDWGYDGKKYLRRHRRWNPRTNTVCVTWPMRWSGTDAKGNKRSGGSWWETRYFNPGPNALIDVCNRALVDKLDVTIAVRCAEAAGLFRK